MALRIKLKISRKNKTVVATAVVNSGYETDIPELLVPMKIVKDLSIDAKLLEEEGIEEHYIFANGKRLTANRLRNAVKVEVLTEDYNSSPITCDLVASKTREVIISDKLTSKLEIVMYRPCKGSLVF